MTERTSLTDADLDRIEANLKFVTPGPWMITPDYEDPVVYVEANIDGGMFVCGMDSHREDDACFIAAAREDVPALIAEVRRLRARIRQLEDIVQWALDEGGWRLIYYSDPPPHDLVDTSDMFGGSEVKRYDTALASAGDAGREGE